MIKIHLSLSACLFLVLLTGTACTSATQEEQLVIFAAASLSNAFDELADQFEAQQPVQVIRHYAGRTQTLPLLVYGALERDINAALWSGMILIGIAAVILWGARELSRVLSDE